jgi:hypothetical protein
LARSKRRSASDHSVGSRSLIYKSYKALRPSATSRHLCCHASAVRPVNLNPPAADEADRLPGIAWSAAAGHAACERDRCERDVLACAAARREASSAAMLIRIHSLIFRGADLQEPVPVSVSPRQVIALHRPSSEYLEEDKASPGRPGRAPSRAFRRSRAAETGVRPCWENLQSRWPPRCAG